MKTCKRIGIFLLLGVMLVGLLISGCTPTQQTEDTTGATDDPNAIVFRDLPGVNMDNIDKISIYYGSADNRKLIRTLDSAEAIAEFRATFEQLRLTKIDSPSSLSSFMPSTKEYHEAFERIYDKTTYRIVIEYGDETQWDFYIVESKRVYYVYEYLRLDETIYFSADEVEYIDALGIGPVLNRSYIEGCAYADIMRSMLDSQIHELLGEENIVTFFDMFFAGLELTDDSERIAEVRKSGYVGTLFQPFEICFTCDENSSLLVSVYENGALIVRYKDRDFASVRDNAVDKQAMEKWLKEHDAL